MSVQVIVPPAFPHDEVQFQVLPVEEEGRYGETFRPVGHRGVLTGCGLATTDVNRGGSGAVFFGSDVDRGIPDLKRPRDHRFALVVGNQDYATSNPGLTRSQLC